MRWEVSKRFAKSIQSELRFVNIISIGRYTEMEKREQVRHTAHEFGRSIIGSLVS